MKKLIIEQDEPIDWDKLEQEADAQIKSDAQKRKQQQQNADQNRRRDDDDQRRPDPEQEKKPKPKIDENELANRIQAMRYAMNFIEDSYVTSIPKLDVITNSAKLNLRSPRVASFISLILNSYSKLGAVNKVHLNYVVTANGQVDMPSYKYYLDDIQNMFNSKAGWSTKNLKGLFQTQINLQINMGSSYKKLAIEARNILISRKIASLRNISTTDEIKYLYTPMYKVYPDPGVKLKQLYDTQFFGPPKVKAKK